MKEFTSTRELITEVLVTSLLHPNYVYRTKHPETHQAIGCYYAATEINPLGCIIGATYMRVFGDLPALLKVEFMQYLQEFTPFATQLPAIHALQQVQDAQDNSINWTEASKILRGSYPLEYAAARVRVEGLKSEELVATTKIQSVALKQVAEV